MSGNPIADAGLRYIGDRVASYQKKYELKSKENDKAWADLINLCKVIKETPADELESALSPILDIEGVLWFLACDVAFINSDGYWTRASDYNIYQNTDGKFHITPHDMNESFREPHKLGRSGGPPGSEILKRIFGPRPGAGGDEARGSASKKPYSLDPLVGLTQTRFPLRSKLLKNPKFKTLYLQYLREIAREPLDWKQLGPKIESWKSLIADEVKADTRKLMSNEAFEDATDLDDTVRPDSLREFVELRSKFLLSHAEIKQLPEDLVRLESSNKKQARKK